MRMETGESSWFVKERNKTVGDSEYSVLMGPKVTTEHEKLRLYIPRRCVSIILNHRDLLLDGKPETSKLQIGNNVEYSKSGDEGERGNG